MNDERPFSDLPSRERLNLLTLAVMAPIVGAITGLVCAVFRITLTHADRLRNILIDWAHGQALQGFLILIGVCAFATAMAAYLVRAFSPYAAGSGIPHAEAVLHGDLPPAPYTLLPVKFIGGILAIGSGLALGREGPSVQMGATIAVLTGRLFRLSWPHCRVLLAAAAGAGLATAFNAPIAGAVFVLEELVQRFEHRVAIAALAASAAAIAVARQLIGNAPDFQIVPVPYAPIEALPLFLLLGAVAGVIAAAYNGSLLAALGLAQRMSKLPVEARAWLIGASVGALAWFLPDLVGGGDNITQRTLTDHPDLTLLAIAFGIRFVLSVISYAAGTPGGLFAPLLVLGAQIGVAFGLVCQMALPTVDIQPEAFALVGMAALFTGVVRAPVTGIVLVTEMTGNVTMLLPMLGACFTAMLAAMLIGSPPIYDSLRELTLRIAQKSQTPAAAPAPPSADSGS